jgi:hypothetical protein
MVSFSLAHLIKARSSASWGLLSPLQNALLKPAGSGVLKEMEEKKQTLSTMGSSDSETYITFNPQRKPSLSKSVQIAWDKT